MTVKQQPLKIISSQPWPFANEDIEGKVSTLNGVCKGYFNSSRAQNLQPYRLTIDYCIKANI